MAEKPADGMVQISEADLKTLQAAYTTLNGLWSSPKHGLAIKRAVKEMRPDTAIPELDIADRYAEPINAEIKTLKEANEKLAKDLADDRQKRADDKALSDVYAKIDDVVKKRGLTDEGKAGLIKTMQDRQIADPDAAALVYLDTIPKAKPITTGGERYLPASLGMHEMGGNSKDDFAKFLSNPIQAFDDAVVDVLNNPEQYAA